LVALGRISSVGAKAMRGLGRREKHKVWAIAGELPLPRDLVERDSTGGLSAL
jgi:hypothetical protein